VANKRKIVTLTLLGLLFLVTVTTATVPGSLAQTPAAVLPHAPPFIELGFGPNSLSPAQQGAPVFTVNDSLWVYSTSPEQLSVDLVSPANVSFKTTISQFGLFSLYTFLSTDPQGDWNLYFAFQNSTYYSVPILFMIMPQNQAPVGLSEYSIQNGEINLGFSVNSINAYNLEGCLTSSATNQTISLADPTTIGSGSISISINTENNSAVVTSTTTSSTPFSFWFDLEYSYTYTSLLANETISRDVLVARSSTILFNGSSSEIVSLPILNNLRSGRYVVRGYFDSGSGFSAEETRLLHLSGDTWFWLSSCNPFSISGAIFSKQVSLASNPSTWPSVLYFMYEYQGIEGYSVLPLQINLARIDFLGTPGSLQLSGFTYTLSNNSDLEASGAFAGSVYVIARSYPLDLTVTPMLGSQSLTPINVVVPRPFSESQYFILIGKLTVEVLNNSSPDIGAKVTVTSLDGATLTSSIPVGGNTSFNLPAGFYDIGVSKGGITETGNATVVVGSNTIVTITATSQQIPVSYLELLLVPLILGLALNLWAWVVSPRRSKYRVR
jgi:hypothetical protein